MSGPAEQREVKDDAARNARAPDAATDEVPAPPSAATGDHLAVGDGGPDVPAMPVLTMEEAEASVDVGGVIRAGKLAGKSMWAAIWILALPVLLQQFLAACVGLVDKILAGQLPQAIVVPAMDAIGIGSYVGWLISVAMAGLGVGGQALIARGMGGGDLFLSGRALGQSITLSIVWGTIVGVAMWLAAKPLAIMCGLKPEATIYCVQYVQALAYAMPFTGIMMVGGMCLHGAGETTMPSLIAVGVNIVNIVGSWALSGVDLKFGEWTLTNPFSFDWHVAGIAAGTALGYMVGAVITLWVLVRGVKDLKLERPQLALDRHMAHRIIRLGVPSFFEGLAMWGVNLFVLIFIGMAAKSSGSNGSGDGLQGAHIIAVQWEALSFLPGFAMGTAAGALAGQYLGAGNPRMARKSMLACTLVACIIMGTLGIVFMTQGRFLTSVISAEAVHLETVPKLLFLAGAVQAFFAIAMVIRQGLRGVGDATWAFLITSVSSYFVRLPLAWLLGVHFGYGIVGIWYALCGELVVRAGLFAARFMHGGWQHLKV